ncbi:uncharacterized protein [Porites lutea]|uniref:uncharacterized protein n=1 Tax=Porites lutea TaxID=51062 RepID=UPI003CC6C423
MESALEALRSVPDPDQVKNALSLMQVYVNNIVKDPDSQKYRKIRITNPKFNSAIWQLEQARTFLLLSGFEQDGEFLVLPFSVNIDGVKVLIDGALGISQSNKSNNAIRSNPTQGSSEPGSAVLKLSSQKGESLFDQDTKADLTLLSYMKELGYDIAVAEQALICTKNKGIQPAIDWINENPGKATVPLEQTAGTAVTTVAAASVVPDLPHSDKSSFSQQSAGTSLSTGPAVVSRFQKTIDDRHKFQERLRLEAIEEAKLEKQRKKLQKEYLLKDLRDEKDERLEKAKLAKLAADTPEPSSTASTEQQCDEGKSSMVELRIRLPDGQILSVGLPRDSTVRALYREINRLWHDNQNVDDFLLLTSFPQRRISEMESTLEAEGLSPRAALVVQKKDQQGVVTQGQGPVLNVKNITKLDEWQEVLNEQDKLVVVQFYADWCALCRSVADSYDSLNVKYGLNGQVVFARVNVDKLKVLKYQQAIASLPTFKLFWNGQSVAQVDGTDMLELEHQIKENLNGPVDDSGEESTSNEMYFDPR